LFPCYGADRFATPFICRAARDATPPHLGRTTPPVSVIWFGCSRTFGLTPHHAFTWFAGAKPAYRFTGVALRDPTWFMDGTTLHSVAGKHNMDADANTTPATTN